MANFRVDTENLASTRYLNTYPGMPTDIQWQIENPKLYCLKVVPAKCPFHLSPSLFMMSNSGNFGIVPNYSSNFPWEWTGHTYYFIPLYQ